MSSDFKPKRHRFLLSYSAVALLFLTAFVLAVRLGSVQMSAAEFFGGAFLSENFTTESIIIYHVRLPRALAAALAGVGLSLSGAVLQLVTGNDLAAPSIIGINSGAGLGAIIFLSFAPLGLGFGGNALLQIFSFAFAFMTTIIVLFLAERVGKGKSSVILAGVAVNAVFNAAISFVSLLDTDVLSSYNSFSIGGFAACEYSQLLIPTAVIFVSLALLLIFHRPINLLSLGYGTAQILGVNVKMVRTGAIIIASALAAASVSFAGLIGFVGLVAPHIAKRLVGYDFSKCAVMSALVGATVTTLADLLGRILVPPTEIPVGIMMAAVGAPFFIILLCKGRRDYL